MEKIWEQYPSAWLALVGFSHNPPEWLQSYLTRSSYASERTINLDDVSHQEREEALAACTLLAAPSISDSFGIVYLDAWRYRKPVIACRDTCAETFVHDGVNGLLVDFAQEGQCADALFALLNDPARAQAMGEAGYQTWDQQFRWEHVADRFAVALTQVP